MCECYKWFQKNNLLDYHKNEWCKESHDDQYQFEMLCLEGASVGLSFKTIMDRRDSYQTAFYNFDIDICANLTDTYLDSLLQDKSLIRNKSKIYSVRKNAQIVQKIQKEFGSFDNYLWSFSDNKVIDHKCKTIEDIPTVSDISTTMSQDMKKRGISYVGPTITYSFLQSIGIVNDHLIDCPDR